MTDDATPQALPEWETGPHRDLTDPRNYLPDDPTPDEDRLADVLDPESANVYLAKVAIRGWGHAKWIGRADGWGKRLWRWLMFAATLAGTNLAVISVYWFHAHDDAVTARANAAADERLNEERRSADQQTARQLRQDIEQLRSVLMRLSGADPLQSRPRPSPPSGSIFAPPDKLSLSSQAKDTDYDIAIHP